MTTSNMMNWPNNSKWEKEIHEATASLLKLSNIPPALKVSQCFCGPCRFKKLRERELHGYFFPKNPFKAKVPPPEHSAAAIIHGLVGFEYLPRYLRELLESKHLIHRDRLCLTTFLWANGVEPNLILKFYTEQECLHDKAAMDHAVSIIKDCRHSEGFRRTSYTWDVVERCNVYLDGRVRQSQSQSQKQKKRRKYTKKDPVRLGPSQKQIINYW
jgi:hypothetical protein